MSTRSRIGIENADGTVTSIYCHWDGYPAHNGRILVEHYKTEAKINKLMKLGSLSCLGGEIGKKHDFNVQIPNTCTAHGRDRGEKDTGPTISENATRMFFDATEGWEEYAYLNRGGYWYYAPVFMSNSNRVVRWRSVAAEVTRLDAEVAARSVIDAKTVDA